jgi:hypothetical protein
VTLSVICPTRNRAALWSTGWVIDSLERQTCPPDELLIAQDHCEDNTTTTILESIRRRRLRFRVRIIDVTAARPGPFPASGIPDNCLFHAAAGEIILHVDDDISLAPRTIEHVRSSFAGNPAATIWYLMTFVDELHNPKPEGKDWRLEYAQRGRWPLIPGGLIRPPLNSQTCTGAIFATTSAVIHDVGGHDLTYCGYHNQDTRLGNRLERFCTGGSYLAALPELSADHFGLTWHLQHLKDAAALRGAYGAARTGPTVANGGRAFWKSSWFDSAYTTLYKSN